MTSQINMKLLWGKIEVSSQDYQLQQNQNEQEGGYTESAIILAPLNYPPTTEQTQEEKWRCV